MRSSISATSKLQYNSTEKLARVAVKHCIFQFVRHNDVDLEQNHFDFFSIEKIAHVVNYIL